MIYFLIVMLCNNQVISSKRYDLEGFSKYAHTLRDSGKFYSQQINNVTYVKQIHATLSQLKIQISPQDKVS